jgi:FMN-dependent oxidoreductase (nitrilotriacetate monooxygenase family)
MSSGAPLHLGVNCVGIGNYDGAWRRPGIDPLGTSGAEYYVRVAQTAERGLFDAVFTADAPGLIPTWETEPQKNSVDPVLAMTVAAQATEFVGVVPTVSTSWHHPWNLARALQSLDRISHGRAGWNVVTSYSPMAAASFGLEQVPEKEKRYARAAEFVEVVDLLWRTWAPDAVVADKSTGRFARPDGVHQVEHRGEFFTVLGGGVVPRSEQGLPVVFQAGGSPEGFALAARFADATFAATATPDGAQDYRRRLDAACAGVRAPGRARVMAFPGLIVTLGSTDEEAARRNDEFFTPEMDAANVRLLASLLGVDTSRLDPDAPLSFDAAAFEERRKHTSEGNLRAVQYVAETGRTVREIGRFSWGHISVVGGPKTVADKMEDFFATGAVDGFNLMFDVTDETFPAFVDEVVPILQERGLFRRKYTAKTLRGHLGLPVPAA